MRQSIQQPEHFATKGRCRKKLLRQFKWTRCPQGKEQLNPLLVSRKRNNTEKDVGFIYEKLQLLWIKGKSMLQKLHRDDEAEVSDPQSGCQWVELPKCQLCIFSNIYF